MEENKKKGFVPQDEEYYQDNRAELPEIPKLDPIVDPNAGTTAVDEGLKRPAPAEPAEGGCGASVGWGAGAVLMAAAAFVARKKD